VSNATSEPHTDWRLYLRAQMMSNMDKSAGRVEPTNQQFHEVSERGVWRDFSSLPTSSSAANGGAMNKDALQFVAALQQGTAWWGQRDFLMVRLPAHPSVIGCLQRPTAN
jgi:hypothetical protein